MFVTEKLRYKASPFMEKKRSFAEHDLRMGWRGLLAISNRQRQRWFAEHDLGWDGVSAVADIKSGAALQERVSVPSGTLWVLLRNM